MMRLQHKVAIVTGGGAGIGRATAERFSEEGAAVIVAERDETSGAEVVRQIQEHGGRARFLATDVAEEASVAAMAAAVESEFGRVDILVNNAAVFVLRGIEATPSDWRKSLDTNVMGPALVAKHVVPLMERTGVGGAIVNLASVSSFLAQPHYVTYNASKAAILAITRCMAMDLAPARIRVNAVCPGAVWTKIVADQAADLGLDRAGADAHPAWGGRHLLGRIAEPREIAHAILFLASDEASFITGTHLMVDGGWTAW